MRKPTFWFPTRSDTNRTAQPHKMARGLKFWIQKVEGLYYTCSENQAADQLRGYREADLRLCFRICKKVVFLMTRPKWLTWPRNDSALQSFLANKQWYSGKCFRAVPDPIVVPVW